MLRFTLAQMRTSIPRLILAAIAIALGTGFVAASFYGASVLRASAESVITADLQGADVTAQGFEVDDAKLERIRAVPGVEQVGVQRSLGVTAAKGGNTYWLDSASVLEGFDAPTLTDGRLPERAGEVAIGAERARQLDVGIGDSFDWTYTSWNPDPEADSEHQSHETRGTLTVVGLLDAGPEVFSSSPMLVTGDQIDVMAEGTLDDYPLTSLFLRTAPGADPATVAEAVDGIDPNLGARSAQQAIDEGVRDLTGSTNFFVVFGLAFAAVAVAVAAMVIANTFEVLVAQRTRTLALLRCGGATKGQVRGSVLLEAVLLGLIGAAFGIALAVGLGSAVAWWLSSRNLGVVVPSIAEVGTATWLVPVLVGMGITLLAALSPATHATRVSPVDALRPTTTDPRDGKRTLRLVLGLLMLLPGLALLGWVCAFVLGHRADESLGVLGDRLDVLLLAGVGGGILTVGGYLVLSVFIVPAMVAALGRLATLVVPKSTKATVRLATANAIRNPRRTAATTSALVIGVGLITLMGTGIATGRATIFDTLSGFFPVDAMVQSNDEQGLDPELADELHAVDGVEHVAEGWYAGTEGGMVLVADPAKASAAMNGDPVEVEPGHVAIDPDLFTQVGDQLQVQFFGPGGEATMNLPTQQVDGLVFGALVAPETVAQYTELGDPQLLAMNLDDDRVDETVEAINEVVAASGGEVAPSVSTPLQERQSLARVIDALLGVLVGLLGVAVVIALVGVANTLSLSVIERRREHGTLRAVGVTRGQLRGALAVEGVLIALGGTAIGVVLGLVTGITGSLVLLGSAPEFTFAVDWRVLVGCLVIAVLAGLLASVLPSRSATRVPVVVALADQ